MCSKSERVSVCSDRVEKETSKEVSFERANEEMIAMKTKKTISQFARSPGSTLTCCTACVLASETRCCCGDALNGDCEDEADDSDEEEGDVVRSISFTHLLMFMSEVLKMSSSMFAVMFSRIRWFYLRSEGGERMILW